MNESRLTRRTVKQNKKQLYISLAAIVAIMFIAINFGPTLIGASGSLIDALTGKSGQADIISSDAEVQAPTIDNTFTATPSATIKLTGKADYKDGTVELYVNGSRAGEAEIVEDQTFEFEDIRLSEGDNFIKARVVRNDKKGNFSEETKISFIKSAPKLDISSPSDKQSFTKADQTVTIKGVTDENSTVTVNGFVAIVDGSGNFSYDIGINQGDNKLTIIATGPSGQTTSKELTVSYSQ